MAYSYTIGIDVEGASKVNAAAKDVDELDDGLGDLSDEARAVSRAFGMTADEAKKMTREFNDSDKALLALADHQGDMASQFATFGGPIGNTVARLYEMREAFNKLTLFAGKGVAIFAATSAVVAALAIVVAAAAVAVLAMAAALVKSAISASDAANETAILRESLTGSASAAGELTSTIKSVAASVPISTAEVGKLAEGLYKAGKRGEELEAALLEASYEAAGLGKNPGPELIAKKMATLGTIGTKLKDNIAEIFSGASTVDATSKFTKALSGITDMFGQNTSEGRALQKLLSVMVDPIINALTEAAPLAKAFFRGLIIGALDIAIFAAKAAKALGLIPPEDAKENIDSLTLALEAGKWAMYGIVAVLAILAIAFGLVVAGAVLVVAVLGGIMGGVLVALVAAVVAVGAAFVVVGKKIFADLAAWATWGSNAATNLVNGLVAGIKSGTGAVVDAIKAMASSAVAAIKSALKIASPSKIFEDLGGYTGEGFAVGIEGETAMVQSSLETMVAPPAVEVPQLQAPTGGGMGGGGRGAVDLSGATFVFNGVKDAEHGASLFEEALTRIFEGDALAVGAA